MRICRKIAALGLCAVLLVSLISMVFAADAAPVLQFDENGEFKILIVADTQDIDKPQKETIALLEADHISNQFEIAAMNIEYDFGLKAEDVVSYKGVKSNDNGDAGLVLVLEAADGKAEDVANQLASYQQDQVAFYGNYAEFAQAQDNVENAVIAFKGNTIVMVIASNECTADLDSAVDSALAD